MPPPGPDQAGRSAPARQASPIWATVVPRELDRHDNILWRVLEGSGLTVSLIPIASMSPPPCFDWSIVLCRAKRFCTSAMRWRRLARGLEGTPWGSLEVEVGPDEIVRQPGQTNFAGSALRPIDGVIRAAAMLNVPWHKCGKKCPSSPLVLWG